jgi:hypothetical protein
MGQGAVQAVFQREYRGRLWNSHLKQVVRKPPPIFFLSIPEGFAKNNANKKQ